MMTVSFFIITNIFQEKYVSSSLCHMLCELLASIDHFSNAKFGKPYNFFTNDNNLDARVVKKHL